MEEYELIGKAVYKAREAFEKTLEEEGIDGAYFDLDLKVYRLSIDFEPLETVTYKSFMSGSRKDNDWNVKEDD